jgi:hypothetical protein
MVLLALWQMLLVHQWRRRGRWDLGKHWSVRSLFWRWMLVGLVASYALSLAWGPDPSARYLFRAALATWYTLALLPLAASPLLAARWSLWHGYRPVRGLEWSLVAVAVALAAVELSLRAIDQLLGGAVVEMLKLPAGSQFRGRLVNGQGYWDDEFEANPRPGRFRVAAIGHHVPLSGTSESNCLAQIERRVPGIEVYNFGVPRIGPGDYAAQLRTDVAKFRPDLILAFISVGDDIAPCTMDKAAETYDWRRLQTVQWAARKLGLPLACSRSETTTAEPNYASYLSDSALRLVICRTPIEPPMQQQWTTTIAHLDGMAEACRGRGIALGLVLVPGEFQVSLGLCETLRRRAGYEASQVDLELPQRRLVGFAHDRKLPVLDLLPHFRASRTPPYHRHQRQLNEHGSQLVTEMVGSWLQTRYGAAMAAK